MWIPENCARKGKIGKKYMYIISTAMAISLLVPDSPVNMKETSTDIDSNTWYHTIAADLQDEIK